ncbi:MAG: hypothetical protein H0W02_10150 [Ktedonobacteraceae bacterium]|nr:hypothetical protein [Ktedonobacteraceae bacterium]
MNTYLDCFQYQALPTGVQVTPFLGNAFRFAGTQAAATTTLSVPGNAVTVQMNAYATLYIFDGPSSEVVQVSGTILPGATSIALVAATQYQHLAGVAVCSDGISGSLGEQILTASRWMEDEMCYQPLWSTTYTGEVLTMPTMRASIDNRSNLHFRPRHFPITALSAISIQTSQQNIAGYDPTQAIIDADQQTVDIPNLQVVSNTQGQAASSIWQPGLSRGNNAWIVITYTAGFAVGKLPRTVMRACALLTSECFQQLENPMGADSIQQNKRNVTFMLRGDQSGESLLVKQARKLLSPYVTQSF